MTKNCPKCGYENPDYAFWCLNCNNKLITNPSTTESIDTSEDYESQIEKLEQKIKLPYTTSQSQIGLAFTALKIPITTIIIVAIIASSFYIFINFNDTTTDFDWDRFGGPLDNFDWDKYGGCPWDENSIPYLDNNFPWAENQNSDDTSKFSGGSHEFTDVGKFDVDYWFNGDTIETNTGWTFSISKVKDCTFQGIVLDYYVYNKDGSVYNPTETFSPVDIFFGYDDIVENPGKYPYKILNHLYRVIFFQCTGEAYAQNYFYLHCSNTHIIPHNKEVLNKLLTINVGGVISLSGSYVDVYGSHYQNNTRCSWTTDTEIGNWHCEIILVDTIDIQ